MSRIWNRLRQPVGEAVLPFLLARVVVLGALGLAHFIIDRTHPDVPAAVTRVHEGLLGWDAGWYEQIARLGYGPFGRESLRFFPLVPLVTHGLAYLPGLGYGSALIVLTNLAAFVATVLFFVLVRRETGDAEVARRGIWFLSLAPAAFVLVMGYAEAVLLCFALGCFLALRPGGGRAQDPAQFRLGRTAGFRGGADAPGRGVGVRGRGHRARALVDATLEMGQRRVGLVALAAPFLGVVVFMGWSDHVTGDFWAPLRVQLESTHHGGISDPFVTLVDDARGLLHHHVGTALHVPWVLVAAVLLVVCWRRLPATFTLFAAAVLAVAVGGSNLDSFERYALSAFPLTMAAAVLIRWPRVERAALVLLAATLAGYSLLAFLNIYVP